MKKIMLMLFFVTRFSYATDCTPEYLSMQLEQMHELDQSLRTESLLANYSQQFSPSSEHEEKAKGIIQKIIAADIQNRHALDEIVQDCGWPQPKKLSYKAYYGVFLTVQHGDAAYRLKYFPYFQKQYEANEFRAGLYAMLVDRMRIDQGKNQLYGTHADPSKNDINVYFNIEDPENLNNRREQMGLSRIKMFDDLYLPQTNKVTSTIKPNKKKSS